MNKLNQFSGRGAYVQPYCKAVELRATQTILAGSYGAGKASNPWIDGSDGVNDYSDEDL